MVKNGGLRNLLLGVALTSLLGWMGYLTMKLDNIEDKIGIVSMRMATNTATLRLLTPRFLGTIQDEGESE